jgi:pyrroloquinoline quinone (PQQ) biosynthesis protein C
MQNIMQSTNENQLQISLAPVRDRLLDHDLYRHLMDARSIRTFMMAHVFAVWDFQSLLKALQRLVTCVEVPWLPTEHRDARRLLNEIVLDEESDEAPDGGYLSHFELYLQAMEECGSDAAPIREFVDRLREGLTVEEALEDGSIPPGVAQFVRTTMDIVRSGEPHRVAAAFAYGREEIIPAMFRKLIEPLADLAPETWRTMLYYLDRHIHTDGDKHAPHARALVRTLCGDDETRWSEAIDTARVALEARGRFWDDILGSVTFDAA